jgi:hypothetical protein
MAKKKVKHEVVMLRADKLKVVKKDTKKKSAAVTAL